MFELSFAKIFVIAVVALIVLGPERLPAVARTAGTIVGRVQRFLASVKAEVNAQTEEAGLNSLKEDLQNSVNSVREGMQEAISSVQQSMSSLKEETSAEIKMISDEVTSKVEVSATEPPSQSDNHSVSEITSDTAESTQSEPNQSTDERTSS